MDNRINIGDKVSVYFTSSQCFGPSEVLAIPQVTGDSWVLKNYDGTITYVQMFERMDKQP